jgi:hypothetical protein
MLLKSRLVVKRDAEARKLLNTGMFANVRTIALTDHYTSTVSAGDARKDAKIRASLNAIPLG